MSTKDLVYRIGADFGDLDRKTDSAITKTREWQKELRRLEAQQRAHRAAITDLGQGLATFGAATAVGLGLAVKAAISWESAFAGVKKTVDESTISYGDLEKGLRNLAKTLPTSHEEIAAVAEAAGQLGIKGKDIVGFTKTMIDLGQTTNLTADEAATALAKFSNIMGTSASDVDRLGAALVALGNDGASTEQDIIHMGLRIAGAGHQVGLTEAQVLAFASALSSVGIEAEAGGSSFSTTMIKMSVAAREGGEAIETFAKVAGMSGQQFATLFQRDATGAIVAFISGLNRMQQAGENVFGVLDDLGLSDIRVRDALLRAAGASDMFTHSLQVGSEAWAENTALAEEAAKRYATTESRLKVAGNQVKDALIDIGAAIIPVFSAAVQSVADVVRAFSELPGPLKDVVAYMGLAATGIALVGGAALIAYPKVLAFREGMRELQATGGAVGGTLGKFGLFMSGPWGAAIGAGVTLLGLFAAGSGAASRRQQELAEAGASVAQAIRDQNGVLNDSVRKAAASAAAEKGLLDLAQDLQIATPRVTDAILQQGDAYDGLMTQLDETIRLGTEVTNTTRGQITTRTDEARAAIDLKEKLKDLVGGKNDDLHKTKQISEATKESTGHQKDAAVSSEELANKAKEAADAFKALVKSMNELNGITLSAREAQRNYLAQLKDTAETLHNNGRGLDNNTEKGRANAEALDKQAKAAGDLAEALAKEAEKQGGAAAGTAAFKASLDASRPALIKTAESFGMSHDEAVAYANSVLAAAAVTGDFAEITNAELTRVRNAVMGIPPGRTVNVGVLSEEAKKKLTELGYKITTLPDGTVTITGNTAPAYAALDQFVRAPAVKYVTVQTKYGPGVKAILGGNIAAAYGGVVAFAGGGTWEDHQPQVARAMPNTVRIWAEPETGNESYIPWAMDRRAAATGVLGYTANAFGYDLSPRSQSASTVHAMTRNVDASTTINGNLIVSRYEDFVREDRQRRAHALFAQGLL